MKFEINNKLNGKVQFTSEIECNNDCAIPVRLGLAVKWAIKNGADLRGADLRDGDLFGADLRYYKSDLYDCYIQRDYLQVGCEKHSWDEWLSFDNKRIIEMDGRQASKWWAVNKPILTAIRKSIEESLK